LTVSVASDSSSQQVISRVDTLAAREYGQSVRAYWDETTHLYLQYGTTFQGGYVKTADGLATPRANNLFLADRAGIEPDHVVLDAGCGVCGPSIDIARHIPDVRIDAVTLSRAQAEVARDAVRAAGLRHRIQVHVADYHQLAFAGSRFDAVIFFESIYSVDLPRLFRETFRVLRPGGRVYAKEVFRQEEIASDLDQASIEEFENLFRYKLRPIGELADAVSAAGFEDVESRDLSDLVSSDHYFKAMTELVFGFPLPTEFGRRHKRRFTSAVLSFGEVRARKPGGTDPR
jgi:cyclopropane fatty-acyl-phospholipid synthase-like methyltransferase